MCLTSTSLKVGSLHSETMPRRLAYSIRHSCNTFIFSWWIGFGFTSVTERYIGGEKENEKKGKRKREREKSGSPRLFLPIRQRKNSRGIDLSLSLQSVAASFSRKLFDAASILCSGNNPFRNNTHAGCQFILRSSHRVCSTKTRQRGYTRTFEAPPMAAPLS